MNRRMYAEDSSVHWKASVSRRCRAFWVSVLPSPEKTVLPNNNRGAQRFWTLSAVSPVFDCSSNAIMEEPATNVAKAIICGRVCDFLRMRKSNTALHMILVWLRMTNGSTEIWRVLDWYSKFCIPHTMPGKHAHSKLWGKDQFSASCFNLS